MPIQCRVVIVVMNFIFLGSEFIRIVTVAVKWKTTYYWEKSITKVHNTKVWRPWTHAKSMHFHSDDFYSCTMTESRIIRTLPIEFCLLERLIFWRYNANKQAVLNTLIHGKKMKAIKKGWLMMLFFKNSEKQLTDNSGDMISIMSLRLGTSTICLINK